MDTYRAWIERYAAMAGDLTGRCYEACEAMLEVFPDLSRHFGWITCERGEGWPHWYLTAPDGSIVDPSALQFAWVTEYGEWDEQHPEVLYECPICGRWVYNGQDECCPLEAYYTILDVIERLASPAPRWVIRG